MMNRYYKHCGSILAIVLLGVWVTFSSALFARASESVGTSLDLRTAISRVARENIPSVVHIEVTQEQEMRNPMLPFENDPFFRYFFDVPRMPKQFKRELRGLGTGMIMDSRGYILSNNHVVGHASDIQVLLSNGKHYKATLVGADPKTDLAVIKINTQEALPQVKFGNSDTVDVGEWVVAIGHPRGLDQTVTQGIISAKHRRGITDPSGYQDFLQTDAAINPGNSGGPLLNLDGEVIGVNAAIVSQSGGFEGIGFAIPSNMALHVAKALIAHGKVARGWLGVSIQDLTPELAKSFGLDSTRGALVSDVAKDGPADRAGLRRGDVVIGYADKQIPDAGGLRNEVAVTPVGQTVQVTVFRKGEKKELQVKIGDLESVTKVLATPLRDRLGAEVQPITSKEVQRYNLGSKEGVAIIWLDPNGPLGMAGLEIGDIILEINGRPIENLKGLADMVGSVKANERIVMLALDHRTGQTGYVQVEVR